MAGSFASILDRPATEIERPKPLPIGTYYCVVKGQPVFDKSANKGTPYVEFTLVPQAVLDDVDQEMLAEALTNPGTGVVKPLSEVTIKATYYYESQGWRLKDFLEHCGIDVEDKSVSIRALIDQAPNCAINVTLRHESDKNNPEIVYSRIGSTAKAE